MGENPRIVNGSAVNQPQSFIHVVQFISRVTNYHIFTYFSIFFIFAGPEGKYFFFTFFVY